MSLNALHTRFKWELLLADGTLIYQGPGRNVHKYNNPVRLRLIPKDPLLDDQVIIHIPKGATPIYFRRVVQDLQGTLQHLGFFVGYELDGEEHLEVRWVL